MSRHPSSSPYIPFLHPVYPTVLSCLPLLLQTEQNNVSELRTACGDTLFTRTCMLMFRSEEQVSLIRSSWPELFVLGLTQCSTQIHIEELMVTVATSLQV